MPSCHSTNDIGLEMIRKPDIIEGTVIISDEQTMGRGQRGNAWVSESGQNLMLSLILAPRFLKPSDQFFLNMAISLAVRETVINFLPESNCQVKWPNDVYLNGVKLAGILIDLEGQALEPSHSVIGIGLNVNMPAQAAEKIDQKWTDLQSNTKEVIDRNALSAQLIHHLLKRLQQHQNEGLTTMLDEWHAQQERSES